MDDQLRSSSVSTIVSSSNSVSTSSSSLESSSPLGSPSLPAPPTTDQSLQISCAQCRWRKKDGDKTTPPLLRCSKCRSVYYCSKECQKAHWKIHKGECSLPSAKRVNNNNKADQFTVECGICLGDMSLGEVSYLPCCGHILCHSCYMEWTGKVIEVDAMGKPTNNSNCPNCRSPPFTDESQVSLVRGHIAAGKAWGHSIMAGCYKSGSGVPQNSKKAFEHFLLAMQGGDKFAISAVGFRYDTGLGVAQSKEKAIECHTKGSDAGLDVCSLNLGLLYSHPGPYQDFEKAIHYMEVGVHQRSMGAHYQLGQWLMDGRCGLRVDKERGIALTTIAADGGLKMAQRNLGTYYYNGDGVPVSYPLSIKYNSIALVELERAVENSTNPPLPQQDRNGAMHTLASSYYFQEGSSQSYMCSYYWFKMFLSTHSTSCKGCEYEVGAKKITEELPKAFASFCNACGKKRKEGDRPMLTCTGCQVGSYCSKECQRADWASHKEICCKLKELLKKGGNKVQRLSK